MTTFVMWFSLTQWLRHPKSAAAERLKRSGVGVVILHALSWLLQRTMEAVKPKSKGKSKKKSARTSQESMYWWDLVSGICSSFKQSFIILLSISLTNQMTVLWRNWSDWAMFVCGRFNWICLAHKGQITDYINHPQKKLTILGYNWLWTLCDAIRLKIFSERPVLARPVLARSFLHLLSSQMHYSERKHNYQGSLIRGWLTAWHTGTQTKYLTPLAHVYTKPH